MLILFFAIVYFVGVKAWFFTSLVVLSLALREFIKFTKQKSKLNYTILQLILTLLIIFPYILANHIDGSYYLNSSFASFSVFALMIFIFFYGSVLKRCKRKFKKRRKLSSKNLLKLNAMFMLYLAFLPAHLFYLEALGKKFLLLALLTAVSCDIFAYLIGKNFGKHQVLPKTSPKKTIEGSLSALIITTFVFTALYIWITGKFYLLNSLKIVLPMLAGLFLAFIAQLGDYYESLLKRCFRVKNSGDILASHGGVLDRIDSHCLTIPLTYIVLVVFHHLNL
ncbi:MAG: phosphatidate cytidylyltransferase [Candidatus Caenarcaniphilales bacterium]|nr:phosphatidate cytidylyltransferase [Candidatus Caenarcaniphilales bacterium]